MVAESRRNRAVQRSKRDGCLLGDGGILLHFATRSATLFSTMIASRLPLALPALALTGCALLYGCGAPEATDEPPVTATSPVVPADSPAVRVAPRAPDEKARRWTQRSAAGTFDVTLSPQQGDAPIGPLHNWVVQVRDAAGDIVEPTGIVIGGGMPGHGHGLPTQPQVTRDLGGGRYLIEGMQFNMAGDWVLTVAIEADGGRLRDQARFEFTLDY